MKRTKLVLLVLLVLTFAGCGKKQTKEQELCSKLEPHVTAYFENTNEFAKFAENTKGFYDEYCSETSNICSALKYVQDMGNKNFDKLDCENLSNSMTKDECETYNQDIEGALNRAPIEQNAYVNAVKLTCEIANNPKEK